MAQLPVQAMCILLKLNQVTRPFTFPIRRYDDAVPEIDTEAKYFIAVE